VRWLADASYWAYLVHLPVVILLQWAVAGAGLGAMTKFTFILGTTMAATLLSYGFLVRGRTVGRLLNGPRG
jgi:peptidoglycan/LPS O-acetylase OafA/YrhL